MSRVTVEQPLAERIAERIVERIGVRADHGAAERIAHRVAQRIAGPPDGYVGPGVGHTIGDDIRHHRAPLTYRALRAAYGEHYAGPTTARTDTRVRSRGL